MCMADPGGNDPERTPDESECRKLLKQYNTPEEVVAHCLAVTRKALEISDALYTGCRIDRELVKAAAMLHDIAKTKTDHAATGADYLMRRGYPRVADIIRSHHCLTPDDLEALNESTIVFYADKLINGTIEVGLEERFSVSRLRCDNNEALASHDLQLRQALKARELIKKHLFGEVFIC